MRMPHCCQRYSFLRIGLIAGLSAVVCLPTGCRSARNSVGQLPGMGWMASSDSDVQFGGWNDTESSAISTPAADATPQVATQGDSPGTTTSGGTSPKRRESYPLKKSESIATQKAEEYPDTGYPSPRELEISAGKDRYPTGKVNSGDVAASESFDAEPKRGFYNQSYEDARGESVATDADGPGRYSRFSDSGSETLPAGDNETLPTNDYASDTTDLSVPSSTSAEGGGSRWDPEPQDDPSGTDSVGAYADNADSESIPEPGASRFSTAPDDLDSESLPDRASDYARDAVSRFGQQVNDAGSGLRGGVDRFTDSTRDAVEAAQEQISDSYGNAQEKLGAAAKPLTDVYPGRSSEDPALEAIDDGSQPYDDYAAESGDFEDSTEQLNAAAPYNDLPPAYEEPSATQGARKPWRPGSTGSYSSEREDDQSRRSPYGVAPASYPAEYQGDRRIAPSYR